VNRCRESAAVSNEDRNLKQEMLAAMATNRVRLGNHFYENNLQYFCATKVILKYKDDHYLYKLTKTLSINCEPNLSCLKKRAFYIFNRYNGNFDRLFSAFSNWTTNISVDRVTHGK